ncbi:MAG TPA: DUF1289 domain-containing protein [Allosphingosinicella sp.]|nr:DUF1289 domain-containing protein [Allosphingosinicella sp.]
MRCAPDPVSSPCVRKCTLDLEDICVGCGRTLDEILEWAGASPGRKQEIRAALPGRLNRR